VGELGYDRAGIHTDVFKHMLEKVASGRPTGPAMNTAVS